MKQKNTSNEDSLSSFFRSDMPLASWDIGGVFRWDKLCMGILGTILLKKNLECKLPDFSGCPPCLWSLDWFSLESLMDVSIYEIYLKAYMKEKVGIFLYFDNPFLTEGDLEDSLGYQLVSILSDNDLNCKNGVYVASPILAKHLRSLFPRLRIRLATNFHIQEEDRTAIYYNNLAMTYDRVAIDPRDGVSPELLASLRDKKKFEVTVNDLCLNTWSERQKYVELLEKMRREPLNMALSVERQQLLKSGGDDSPFVPSGSRPLTLTLSEVSSLYSMGFRHFRIQTESMSNELTFVHFTTKHFLTSSPSMDNKKAVIETVLLINRTSDIKSLPSGMQKYRIRNYD